MNRAQTHLGHFRDTEGRTSESRIDEATRPAPSHLRIFFQPKALVVAVKSAISEFQADNAQRMSAALAYYTIFSIAPLVVIAIAISGLVFGEKAAEGRIVAEIQGFVGHDSAEAIQAMVRSAQRPIHGTIATIVGIVALLWGASSVFTEMHDALNTIWDVDANKQSGVWNLVKTRFLSFGMVLAIGFLLLVSLIVSAVLGGLGKFVEARVGTPAAVFHALDFVISIMVVAVLFALIFRVLPNLWIPWSDVWIGALLTSALFTVGKFLIGFYIGKSVSASAYGAAGSLVILVMWVYYSTLILYFGAEFTHIFSTRYGSKKQQQFGSVTPQKAAN